MISKDDIKKLSELARIEVSEAESERLVVEIDSILEYVGQVREVAGEMEEGVQIGPVVNVMREDTDPTPPGTYSREIITEFPSKDGDYLKVKKIL